MSTGGVTFGAYEEQARREAERWRADMLREPGMLSWAASRMQGKINSYIPEKAHTAITGVIKQMTQAVLAGSQIVAPVPMREGSLQTREEHALLAIEGYRKTAAIEGGVTGAGGILLGLADFPLLLGIKLRLLFDIAAFYGHCCEEFSERLYLLHIFQLAFSSQQHRRATFLQMDGWDTKVASLPKSFGEFDWRTYQQEYRNYIDLAKLLQLVPIIGAPVGAVVNYRLVKQLGESAINAYRLRWFAAARPQIPAQKTSLMG